MDDQWLSNKRKWLNCIKDLEVKIFTIIYKKMFKGCLTCKTIE